MDKVKYGISHQKAFGLDKSYVAIEDTPLLYQPVSHFELTRNN